MTKLLQCWDLLLQALGQVLLWARLSLTMLACLVGLAIWLLFETLARWLTGKP